MKFKSILLITGITFVGILMIFFLMVIGIGLPDFKPSTITPGYSGNYLDIQGHKIRYRQQGNGPDVLLIHGMFGSTDEWSYLIPYLEKDYTITLYDRPGNGFSSLTYTHDPLQYNIDMAAAVIEKLDLQNPIVLGHSYGGAIVLGLAVHYPDHIKAAMAISSVIYPKKKVDFIYKLLSVPVVGRGIVRLIKDSVLPPMIDKGFRDAFVPNQDQIPPGYMSRIREILSSTRTLVGGALEESYIIKSITMLSKEYSRIMTPLVILHGEDDTLCDAESALRLKQTIPGARLDILDNTGHMIQIQYPEKIKNLTDYLYQLPDNLNRL